VISDSAKLLVVIPLTIAIGVMLSPESLVILGNGVGSGGALFLVFLALALTAHLLTVLTYGEFSYRYPHSIGEVLLLKETFGSVWATILSLCSKVLFAICASAGILATAGYVFNEVFVYWFPNLGFSFCLLGLLLVINLSGRKVANTAQIIFVLIALSGLVFLLFAGVSGWANEPKVANTLNPLSMNFARVALMGFLIFIGYDLAALTRKESQGHHGSFTLLLVYSIVFIGVLFSAWGLVSITYVPVEKLADTTVPYMVAARAILGQNGRVVMGMVVLAGSLSAVNGLLLAVSTMLGNMARHGFLPSLFAGKPERSTVGLILLTIGIGSMMGLGFAGEPVLEIYIRTAILFWLLNYSAVHLGVLLAKTEISAEPRRASPLKWHPAVSVVGLLLTFGGFAGLLWTEPELAELIKFMITLVGVLSIMSLIWQRLGGKRTSPVRLKVGKAQTN
jgi:amino acid transporter